MKCRKQIGFNLYSSLCQPFFFTTSFFPTLSNLALSKCQCHLYLVTLSAIALAFRPLPGIHDPPSLVLGASFKISISHLLTLHHHWPDSGSSSHHLLPPSRILLCESDCQKTLEFLHIFLLAVIFALFLDVISTYWLVPRHSDVHLSA